MSVQSTSRDGGRRQRVKIPLLVKLLVAFAVPTTAVFAVFAFFAHEVADRELDDELGKRLTVIASATAAQIQDPAFLAGLQAEEDDDRSYKRANRTLSAMAKATGVTRLYLFDREFRSKGDSSEEVTLGTKYHQAELDRTELETMFLIGEPTASVLFEGQDGRFYKAAYAAVRDGREHDGDIVLAVGVDAPADYFRRVTALRGTLLWYGAILIGVVITIAIGMALLINRPVRHLVRAAQRIGDGDLEHEIVAASRDELGVLATTMDRMRSDLQARDEHTQMMLAGIAHEVRNPLGGIELFAGILREEIEAGDERRPHVDKIIRELDYLKRVVEQFLSYARRPRPEPRALDIGELCSELLGLVAGDAGAADVQVEAEVLGRVTALADPGLLRRALLNLLHNAIQAATGDDDPIVRLSAVATGETVEITVYNRGQAIPEELRERIFEPFYTSREKGTGLGLAFVREIARDHGGSISLVSEPGSGTSFTLSLPATRPRESP